MLRFSNQMEVSLKAEWLWLLLIIVIKSAEAGIMSFKSVSENLVQSEVNGLH